MRRFVLILAAATAALALFLLNATSPATTQLLSAPATTAPPLRHSNDTAGRREAQIAATPVVAVNFTETLNLTNTTVYDALLINMSKTASVEHCPAQTTTCVTVSALNASVTRSESPAPVATLGEESQAVAAGGNASFVVWPLHLAFGGAGAALYGYGLYLSACSGSVCRWRRFRAMAPLSAATVLTSIALSAASPLFLAMAAPGVWGLIHYYRARRRLALWLSSTLT